MWFSSMGAYKATGLAGGSFSQVMKTAYLYSFQFSGVISFHCSQFPSIAAESKGILPRHCCWAWVRQILTFVVPQNFTFLWTHEGRTIADPGSSSVLHQQSVLLFCSKSCNRIAENAAGYIENVQMPDGSRYMSLLEF